jgi:hypothetical protein
MLTAQGLTLLRCSKPKPTETTHRWKFEIGVREWRDKKKD